MRTEYAHLEHSVDDRLVRRRRQPAHRQERGYPHAIFRGRPIVQTRLQVQLHRFSATGDVWHELRSLTECEPEHIVVRYLPHEMQDVVEVRQYEFLQGLPLRRLRWGFAV